MYRAVSEVETENPGVAIPLGDTEVIHEPDSRIGPAPFPQPEGALGMPGHMPRPSTWPRAFASQ